MYTVKTSIIKGVNKRNKKVNEGFVSYDSFFLIVFYNIYKE